MQFRNGFWCVVFNIHGHEGLFGKLSEPVFKKEDLVSDLTIVEKLFLFPLALLCLFLGIYPQPMIDTIRPEIHLIAKLNLQANNLLPLAKMDK